MTTWTMDQVQQVRGLRATCRVSREQIHRSDGEAAEYAKRLMAKRLTEMAHAFAVEVHEDDYEFLVSDGSENLWDVRIDCRWNPPTNEAEIHGGHHDGRVLAVQRIGDPLHLEAIAPSPWLGDETAAEMTLVPISERYECDGWNEQARRWVYRRR